MEKQNYQKPVCVSIAVALDEHSVICTSFEGNSAGSFEENEWTIIED